MGGEEGKGEEERGEEKEWEKEGKKEEENLNASRGEEKSHVLQYAGFSSETEDYEGKRQSQVMKVESVQPRLLYPAKLPITMDGENKISRQIKI